ncbi:hypothetical protein [Petrachloros mirabilis]
MEVVVLATGLGLLLGFLLVMAWLNRRRRTARARRNRPVRRLWIRV